MTCAARCTARLFAEFEKAIHAAEEDGEALTLDTFKTIYRGLLTKYFGPTSPSTPSWNSRACASRISTARSMSTNTPPASPPPWPLAEQVLTTGDASRYLNFLRSGGSRFPIETLVEAGVDMSSPKPVAAALRLFERRVGELEALLG